MINTNHVCYKQMNKIKYIYKTNIQRDRRKSVRNILRNSVYPSHELQNEKYLFSCLHANGRSKIITCLTFNYCLPVKRCKYLYFSQKNSEKENQEKKELGKVHRCADLQTLFT